MRTTFNIPQDLLAEAQREFGFKSKNDVVIFSLKELLRWRKVQKLLEFQGKFLMPKSLRGKTKKSKN